MKDAQCDRIDGTLIVNYGRHDAAGKDALIQMAASQTAGRCRLILQLCTLDGGAAKVPLRGGSRVRSYHFLHAITHIGALCICGAFLHAALGKILDCACGCHVSSARTPLTIERNSVLGCRACAVAGRLGLQRVNVAKAPPRAATEAQSVNDFMSHCTNEFGNIRSICRDLRWANIGAPHGWFVKFVTLAGKGIC